MFHGNPTHVFMYLRVSKICVRRALWFIFYGKCPLRSNNLFPSDKLVYFEVLFLSRTFICSHIAAFHYGWPSQRQRKFELKTKYLKTDNKVVNLHDG